jgi:hypothetical protein
VQRRDETCGTILRIDNTADFITSSDIVNVLRLFILPRRNRYQAVTLTR